jgi:hypothetical protein
MGKITSFVYGAAIGAGLMYLYDPAMGNRRRALLRDQWTRLGNVTQDTSGDVTNDLGNRLRGLVAEIQGRLSPQQVPDDVLEARVRSNLGRVVSHPGAITVTANDGRVMLSGPVLAAEAPRLLASSRLVRGVKSVDNQLDVHEAPDSVPGLQGSTPAAAAR